jgi:phosphoribosylaminoimidazolecarboxamide formyltransferase/IMP cyclohydrolase
MNFRLLQGKEMSYNNYLDAEAALAVVSPKYSKPYAACVVKHHNPCGIAVGDDPLKTFMNGRDADEKSAFGGIVGLNYKVDLSIAKEIRRSFFEVVIAPSYDDSALRELSSKKNLRVIEADPADFEAIRQGSARLYQGIFGVLMQSQDIAMESWNELQIVSSMKPDDKLKEDILLGLIFIRFLKSNAICLVKNGVMIGAGLGQMSRVDAVEIALNRAGKLARGAIMASDGFFPFADSIELAAKAGVSCVISPAGSKRDIEVVDMANKLKLPLIFSPYRHFRH